MEFAWLLLVLLVILVFLLLRWIVIFVNRNTKRISRTEDLPDDCAGIWLSGKVTGISDGDGFKFFHCPWFMSSQLTFEDDWLRVRLAGIDAPEMGNTKKHGQPFARKSKEYLGNLIDNQNIKIKVVGKDQYNRVLAFAYLPGCLPIECLYTNVNCEMVEKGLACVYKGRDAIYDGHKETLKSLEEDARNGRKGMWSNPNVVTPMDYKKMTRNERT